MANKTPKVRHSSERPVISSPLTFTHLAHVETARQSPDGRQSPLPSPSHNTNTKNNVFNQELLESMIRRIVQSELEPIKASQNEILKLLTNSTFSDTLAETLATTSQHTGCDLEPTEDDQHTVDEDITNQGNADVRESDSDGDIYVNINSIRDHTENKNRVKRTSLSNPTYNKVCEVTISSVDKKNDEGIITSKNQSTGEVRAKKPMPSPRLHSERRDILPVDQNGKPPRMKRRKAVKKVPVNERECLANAIQSNIEYIIDDLIFNESELPDQLLADGCVTDVECLEIRKRNGKDQIRILVSIIKSRDMCVLEKFVKRIKSSNKELAARIYKTFEDNKSNRLSRDARCPCCELIATVDIKYVADGLWGTESITDGLYREIASTEKHAGSQDELWKRLIDAINSIPKKESRKKAYTCLVRNVSSKNYQYIANSIDRAVTNDRTIVCDCVVPFTRADNLSVNSKASSISPCSSIDGRVHATSSQDISTVFTQSGD